METDGLTLPGALIRLNHLGDLGMSEMIGLMRLHVQEVTRFTSIVASNLRLTEHQRQQFEADCQQDGLDPVPFLDGPTDGARLTDTGVFLLAVSAKVHDIGKPFFREIYSQARRLTREEFQLQKLHTNLGRLIIQSWGEHCHVLCRFKALTRYVARVAPAHQEKFDGSGYPDGLAGERIPIAGRLLGITDAISALINERPYTSPVSLTDCLERLGRDKGSHFDPDLFDAVLDMHRRDVLTDERVRGEWLEKERFSEDYLDFVRGVQLEPERMHPVDAGQLDLISQLVQRAIRTPES